MTIDHSAFHNHELGSSLTLQDVEDTFEFLTDWEDRYAYIVELGRKLPPFPEDARTEANKVHGCQSQVWLTHYLDPDSGKLYLLLDSDALIVRGLAAMIMIAMNGHTAAELLKIDVDGLFQRLDLFRHMSPTRGNGLRAMVARIRALAASQA